MATELTNFLGVQVKDLATDPSFDSARLGLSADPTTGKLYKVTIEEWITLLTGLGVAYAGPADTDTNPGTPSGAVFYSASAAGTYTNFLDSSSTALVLASGEFAFLSYDGTAWTKQVFSIDLTNYATTSDLTDNMDSISGYYPGKNLIDKSEIVANSLYSPANNDVRANSSSRRTGYIPVEEGKTYTYSGTTTLSGGYFENDGDTGGVSSITFTGGTFTVPTGQSIGYVVLNVTSSGGTDTTNDNTVQLEIGNTATSYEAYDYRRRVADTDLKETYAKESELTDFNAELDGKVASTYLFDKISFNKIDPSVVDFAHRYSISSKKVITADSALIAASAYIPVEEGQFYTVSGDGIYSGYQGGYFAASGDINAVDNITFLDPFTGSGKMFQVPTGEGINYVIISLTTNAGHTALVGDSQMEEGKSATDYQPYELKDYVKTDFIRDTDSGTTDNTPEVWENRYPQVYPNLAHFLPKYFFGSGTGEDRCRIILWGDSLLARTNHTSIGDVVASANPPCLTSQNFAAWLWDELRGNKPDYARYDASDVFTETGTFSTLTDDANWDDKTVLDGPTRVSTDSGASVAFTISGTYNYFNLLDRTDISGTDTVTVAVSEGNGYLLAKVDGGASWVEANGFTFSQLQSTSELKVGNTLYQRRILFKKTGSGVDASVTVTISKGTDTGRLLYWGLEKIGGDKPYVQLVNSARGEHTIQTLLPTMYGDVINRSPDLVVFEIPLMNMIEADSGLTNTLNWVQDIIWGDRVEGTSWALKAKSNSWVDFSILVIIPHYKQAWFNSDGSFKVLSSGYTAQEIYQAVKGLIYSKGEVSFIDVSSAMDAEIVADPLFEGNLYNALASSSFTGNTYTDDGGHANDKGAKVWAKTLCPVFWGNTL